MNVQLSDLRFNRTARLSYESSSLLCEVARVSRVVLSFARRKINCEIISPRKSSFDFCQQLVVWHTACVVLMENNFPPLSFASTTLTTFTYSAFLLFTSRKIHGFNHWKAFFFRLLLCPLRKKNFGNHFPGNFSRCQLHSLIITRTHLQIYTDFPRFSFSLFALLIKTLYFFFFLFLLYFFAHTHPPLFSASFRIGRRIFI